MKTQPPLATDERYVAMPGGGMLYDAARLRNPDAAVFTREYWAAQGRLREAPGGRGSVAFVRADEGDWVLRHYRRGGMVAAISADRYLWLGADRTRSFREWRLLAELQHRGLPVPAPIAARFVRNGPTYRADLITEQLATARTLADAITGTALPLDRWREVGSTISLFHRHGVHHADLNAHNILLTDARERHRVFVLDFDRGRIRPRGSWEARVLARLRRSLDKVSSRRANVSFENAHWEELMRGYYAAAPVRAEPC